MKTKVIVLWSAFAVCLVAAVALWFAMNNAKTPDYEEVKAMVVSSETKSVVNKKTHSKTDFYDVKVSYNGETYDLINVHNSYSYREGQMVTALLSDGKLYANVEGITSSTPVAKVYFVFLGGSFVLLMVAATYSSKYSQQKKAEKAAAETM